MAVTFALIALFGEQNKSLMYFSLCAFIYVLAVSRVWLFIWELY